MASVNFPTSLGGDGRTYSDDANPNTGLANGGHRTRFVPILTNTVAMASRARREAGNAQGSANAAQGYVESIRDLAEEIGARFYPTVRPTLSLDFVDDVYRIYEI